MRYAIVLGCAVAAFFGGAARAAIVAVAGTSPIRISAKIGDDGSFSGGVEMMSDVAVTDLLVTWEELKREDGTARIAREQVTLSWTGKLALEAATPQYVGIKLTGVKEPGVYKGQLFFYQHGAGLIPALTVPIQVTVHSTPAVAPCKDSQSLTIQLVRCNRIDCWVSKLLDPKAFVGQQSICLMNSTHEAFTISATVEGRGDVTHAPIGNGLKVDSTLTVPVQQLFNMPLTFGATPIADHYRSTLYLTAGNDSLATIPLDVNVRSGPLVPFVVLVAGIIVGRLLKYMKDKGGPQSDLLLALYQLEGRIAPNDRMVLQPMIEKAKAQIYDMQLDAGRTALTAIKNRWSLLGTLQDLRDTLQPRQNEAGVQAILQRIATARTLIAAEQDQQAATEVEAIKSDVQHLKAAAPAGAAGVYSLASSQANTATVAANTAAKQPQQPLVPWWARFLGYLSGVAGALRAETTLWLVRPVFYLLLIVALCALGMQQLYLKNPTFGSDPFSDYFGMLVWAMSSDVASRTLSSLKPDS